jgi:hypothetical protein
MNAIIGATAVMPNLAPGFVLDGAKVKPVAGAQQNVKLIPFKSEDDVQDEDQDEVRAQVEAKVRAQEKSDGSGGSGGGKKKVRAQEKSDGSGGSGGARVKNNAGNKKADGSGGSGGGKRKVRAQEESDGSGGLESPAGGARVQTDAELKKQKVDKKKQDAATHKKFMNEVWSQGQH